MNDRPFPPDRGWHVLRVHRRASQHTTPELQDWQWTERARTRSEPVRAACAVLCCADEASSTPERVPGPPSRPWTMPAHIRGRVHWARLLGVRVPRAAPAPLTCACRSPDGDSPLGRPPCGRLAPGGRGPSPSRRQGTAQRLYLGAAYVPSLRYGAAAGFRGPEPPRPPIRFGGLRSVRVANCPSWQGPSRML
jgi:hypothetical protein